MNVAELFQRLSYGPLSNLAIGGDGNGSIPNEKMPSIVLCTNDALLRLYTRFALSEKLLTIKQMAILSFYELIPSNTYSASQSLNPPAGFPFIQDSVAKPFLDDVIKILAVFDVSGNDIPLNEEKVCGSYGTPENNILQIPTPVEGNITQVVYQARHPKLSFDPVDLTAQIKLPPALEEALVAYIGYQQYSNMNSQEAAIRANDLLTRYNTICAEVEGAGVVNRGDVSSSSKLHDRGFV